MRFIFAAVVTVLCACAPAPAPVVEPPPAAPPAAPAPQRDYDVLLEVSAELSVRARLFPNAPVTGVEVLAFSTADATPTTSWRATLAGDAAPVPAGTALTLGALPAGWVEEAPFVPATPGVTWVVTLTAADGTGRATRFLTDTRVQPTLQVDKGAGLLVVETVPAVPVTRVTLSALDGGALWEGRAPVAAGVTLPSGGLVIGDAPATWDALRFPTAANLVSGRRYRLEVAVPGDAVVDAQVLRQEVLFVGADTGPQLAPIQNATVALPEYTGNQGWEYAQVFETHGARAFGFQWATSPSSQDPVTYYLEPLGRQSSSPGFFDPTPMTGLTGPGLTAPMSTMRTLWAMSAPFPFDQNRAGFAAVYSTSRATPGQLMVVERQPGGLSMNGGAPWDSGWKLVGAPLGPAIPSTSEVETHVARGLVTGLPQDTTRPWLVALVNRTKPADFTFAYLNSTGAWITLGAAGLAPPGNSLVAVCRMRHLVGSDGALYALTLVRSNTAANELVTEFVLARYDVAANRWERLHAAPGRLAQANDESAGFHLAERDGALVATAMSVTPDDLTGYYMVMRSKAGVVQERTFAHSALDESGRRTVRIRDLAIDAQGRALLLLFMRVATGDEAWTPTVRVAVLSQDSTGLGVARLVDSPLPEYMPTANDVRYVSMIDVSFAPQGRAVLALTSGTRAEWRNGIRYVTPHSLLWRMPTP